MKISVVIPAYNEEDFLPQLLSSLKKQKTSYDFEYIVVDNNSTDQTAALAKKHGAKVILEKKRGYAFACNRGFKEAQGDIIARADADYYQPPDWIQKIGDTFAREKETIAIGGPTYPLESYFWENMLYYPWVLLWMYMLRVAGRGFLFPNMALRKEVFEKTGGFDTTLTFGEDTDMCMKLCRLGNVKLAPSFYNYSSIRRLRSLGLMQIIVGYSLANQIAMWRGKKATVGLDPVRIVPKEKPHPYKPWIFLFVTTPLFFLFVYFLLVQIMK